MRRIFDVGFSDQHNAQIWEQSVYAFTFYL